MIVYFDFHKLYKILIIHVYLELMKRFFEIIISSNKTIDNNQYFLIINFIIEFYHHKFLIKKDSNYVEFQTEASENKIKELSIEVVISKV